MYLAHAIRGKLHPRPDTAHAFPDLGADRTVCKVESKPLYEARMVHFPLLMTSEHTHKMMTFKKICDTWRAIFFKIFCSATEIGCTLSAAEEFSLRANAGKTRRRCVIGLNREKNLKIKKKNNCNSVEKLHSDSLKYRLTM